MPPSRTIRAPDRVTSINNFPTSNPLFASLHPNHRDLDVSRRLKLGKWRAGGGYADIYDGELKLRKRDGGGKDRKSIKVAVKRFRAFMGADPGSAGRISRELKVLTRIKHTNIIPFRGFALVNDVPALITDWMENGTLSKYLSDNDKIDNLFLATEIAKGLEYLHSNSVIHSDLKSDNILMNIDGIPLLTDFGISRIVEESVTLTGTSSLKGNTRWMSIELLNPDILEGSTKKHEFHTKQSDVWAYGMVLYEILAGKVPFSEYANELQVMLAIVSGKLPTKPERLKAGSSGMWAICEQCWYRNPADRPSMQTVLERLNGIRVELSLINGFGDGSGVVTCVAFSPVHAQTLATSSLDNISLWTLSKDGKTAMRHHELTGHSGLVRSVAWSSDGTFLLSGSNDKTVRKWRSSTGDCIFAVQTPNWVYAVACSPDNKHFVSGGDNVSLYVWDSSTGTKTFGPLSGHTNDVYTVAYSPSGRQFISGSDDNSIIIWDSDTGAKLFGPLTAHSDRILSIAFNPFGKTFVTGSEDRTITIWDASTFKPIYKNLLAHSDTVWSLQYSTDGRFILSTSWDETLRVWDAREGKVLSEQMSHAWPVWTAAFSPDGRWVASGDEGGQVKIWEFRVLDSY